LIVQVLIVLGLEKKGEKKMNRRLRELGVLISVLCLTFLFTAGCAKKQSISGDAAAAKQAGAEAMVSTGKSGPTPEELAAMEREMSQKELTEQALLERAEKERLAREQAKKERLASEEETAGAGKAAKGKDVLGDILFEYDQFSLTSEAREMLQKHAKWLRAHAGYSLVIEGHCDDRGTTEYNLALGERRAVETMKFLVALGIDKSRIKTISYGEEMPLDPAGTDEAWAKNRRAHFVVKAKN